MSSIDVGSGAPSTLIDRPIPPTPRSGRLLTAPAALIPGSPLRRSSTALTSATSAAFRRPAIVSWSVPTCSGFIPICSESSRSWLRSMSPEPTSSITVSASSAVTNTRRGPPMPPAVAPTPPPDLIVSVASARELPSAGQRPKINPVTIASAAANVRTLKSNSTGATPARLRGIIARKTLNAAGASSRPSTAPVKASTRLSASSWRTIRWRDAPSTSRSAISRRRETASEMRRLATFEQAMSRSSSAAPIRIANDVRVSPTSCVLSGSNVPPARSCFISVAKYVVPGGPSGPASSGQPCENGRGEPPVEWREGLHRDRHGQRDPQIALIRKVEARSHDADHGISISIELDRLADHVGTAELVAPEGVGEHGGTRAVRPAFVVVEHSSGLRRGAEQREEVGGDDADPHPPRARRVGQVETACRIGGHTAEQIGHPARVWDVDVVRSASRRVVRFAHRNVDVRQRHQPIGLEKRKRPEERRVDRAEHGGRGADAERGDENRRDGESRTGAEAARREANVGHRVLGPV